MPRLASIFGVALTVLCGVTIGADVKHTGNTSAGQSSVATLSAGQPGASPSSFLSAPSCVVPLAVNGVAAAPAQRRVSGSRPPARPAVQVTRNDRVDVTLEVRQRGDGSAEVTGNSGDLAISKTVAPDGGFVLDLMIPSDHISIAASGQGTTVTRNGTTVSLPRTSASEEKFGEARRLLAGSKALLQFRRIGAALTDADDRSGPALAMVIADAAVGQLTGDVGAVRRAARYLAHDGAANATRVALRPECFQIMESDMMFALNDYAACLSSVWGNVFWEDLCAWRWIVEVESVWFQFIACSGLGGIF